MVLGGCNSCHHGGNIGLDGGNIVMDGCNMGLDGSNRVMHGSIVFMVVTGVSMMET